MIPPDCYMISYKNNYNTNSSNIFVCDISANYLSKLRSVIGLLERLEVVSHLFCCLEIKQIHDDLHTNED